MAEINLSYLVTLKPEAAIAFLKDKGFAISFNWEDVWQEAHTQAFTVAKAMKLDILQDIRDEVQNALDNGLTFQAFRKNLEPTLKRKGWWGKEELVDEATGEITAVQLGSPYRIRTIYETNLQTAYMAGRYREQRNNVKNRSYWMYVAVMDKKTRPAHAALNGLVFRYDDPFWNSHYPPNGFRCRCRVRALDQERLDEKTKAGEALLESSKGKLSTEDRLVSKKTGQMEPVTVFTATDRLTGKPIKVAPDVGWNYNPGKSNWQPDPNKYDKEIKKLL